MNNEKGLPDARLNWDKAAPAFDDEPDHGLRDPWVLEAWTNFLRTSLPYVNAVILDVGCGTGSLSVVLAGLGHRVTGIDFSPAMIALARTKAEKLGLLIDFKVMDAGAPQLPHEKFDVIVCRHLLWALPKPRQVLQSWAELLKPKGRLLLIEGYWRTGAGLHAHEITQSLPPAFINVSVQTLSDNANFWGTVVTDERYAIIADKN